MQSRGNGGTESGVEAPRPVISKNGGARNSRGDGRQERDMVRSVSGERGEGRRREQGVPRIINEDTVEADKGRVGAAIGPSVTSVPKGKVN